MNWQVTFTANYKDDTEETWIVTASDPALEIAEAMKFHAEAISWVITMALVIS